MNTGTSSEIEKNTKWLDRKRTTDERRTYLSYNEKEDISNKKYKRKR